MRRAALSGLCALAALLVAGAAQAQTDLLADLRRYCVPEGGAPIAAVDRADSDGWQPVPGFMIPSLPRGMEGVEARLRTTSQSLQMLMQARGTLPLRGGDPVEVEMCVVATQPQDHRALERAAAAFAGVRAQNGGEMYLWAETPEGRVPIDDPEDREFIGLLQRGAVRMIFVSRRGDMSMVGYAIPRLRGQAL